MSGFLSLFGGTVIIDALTGEVVDGAASRPEWWVEVKKTLAQGDYEKAQRFLVGDMGVTARADAPEDAMMKQTTDLVGYQRELVFTALEDWNLTDQDGQRLPLANLEDKRRSIAKLPPSVFVAIYSVVSDLNGPRGAEEKATFPSEGGAGASVGSEPAEDDAAVRVGIGALETAGA